MEVESSVVSGVVVSLHFAVQDRRANGGIVYKDTICFGGIRQPGCPPYSYIPAVSYQSAKDNYNKERGRKEALIKFLKRNNIGKLARTEAWNTFNKTHHPDRVKVGVTDA